MANELLINVKYVLQGGDLDKAAQKLGVVRNEEIKLETEMNDVTSAARRQATEFAKAGAAGTKAAQDTNQQYKMLGSGLGSIQQALIGAFAISTIIDYGKAIVDVTTRFQSLKNAIDFASGGVEQGALNFQYLIETTDRLGLNLLSSAEGFKQLLAAAKPAGLSLSQTKDIFEGAATAATAMGLSVQDQEGIFLAFSQILSKGKVQAEELRGQIGERLPGAFNFAAKAMNVTTAELSKMLELGQVSSNEFLPKFARVLNDEFSPAIEKAGESMRANINEFQSVKDLLYSDLGNSSGGFINFAIKDITGFMRVMDKLVTGGYTEYGKELANTFSGLKEGITGLNSADDAVVKLQTLQIGASVLREEMADLRKAIKDNEEAILRSVNPFEEFSASTARLSDKKIELRKNLEKLKAQYDAYIKAIGLAKEKQKEFTDAATADGVGKKQIGTIEELRLKIKAITTERDTQVNLSQKQANAYNREIDRLQKQLDLLTKISKEKYSPNKRIAHLAEIDKIDELTSELDKAHKDRYDKESEAIKNRMALKTKEAAEEKAIRDYNDKEFYAALDEKERREREARQAGVDFAILAANLYLDYQAQTLQVQQDKLDAYYSREMELAGDNATAKKTLEEQYQKKRSELAEKQAQNEKNSALFNIFVSGAEKFVEALGNPALMAVVAATTAIQLAAVQARPIPKFAKGTRSVMGGTPGEDSVLAMLMPGERVVTTEKNRTLSPAFDILTDSKRPAHFWNKTLMEIEKFGVFSPPNISEINQLSSNNNFNDERIIKALNNLTIERFNIDENGFSRRIERKGSRITKLNKHYGF